MTDAPPTLLVELGRIWEAGGPLMAPLALLCLAISVWIALLYPRLRAFCRSGRGLADRLGGVDAAGLPAALERWAAERPGPVPRLAAWAARNAPGPRALRDRVAEARLAELPRLARELAVLRALVAAAPLLGLLGTVRGMIHTFLVLSTRGTAGMELLSGGISEALVTTQVGLVIAVPGIIGAFAAGRRLAEAEAVTEQVEARLAAVARRGRGAA